MSKAWLSESRVRFVSASVLPRHSRAVPTEPQHLSCSTARAHGAPLVSAEPTISYQGVSEDLVTQRIFPLRTVCIEHSLILCISHNHNTSASCICKAIIFILNQFIFIYSIKGDYVHRTTAILSSHRAAPCTKPVSSATSPVPEEFVSTAKTLY